MIINNLWKKCNQIKPCIINRKGILKKKLTISIRIKTYKNKSQLTTQPIIDIQEI